MSRFQQCVVNGDHKNFIRRFRMICIALSRRLSHSGRTPDEATVVQMAIKVCFFRQYVPSCNNSMQDKSTILSGYSFSILRSIRADYSHHDIVVQSRCDKNLREHGPWLLSVCR